MACSRTMKSASESNLEYAALDPSAERIRLIDLLPGHFDQDLTCKMRVTSLRDPPEYEALSYVWGTTANKRPILVNCKIIHVTANLEEALRYLRRPEQTTTIWVDAVCINQDDQKEKTIQVNMMSSIHSKSTRGAVWLGDYHKYGLVGEQVHEVFESVRTVASQELDVDTTGLTINVGDIKPAATKALEDFMENPWWLRIWTVQEVIFPPEVIVHWGRSIDHVEISRKHHESIGTSP